MNTERRQSRSTTFFAAIGILAILSTACASDDGDPAATETDNDSVDGADTDQANGTEGGIEEEEAAESSDTVFDPENPHQLVDGLLPPTADGFPDSELTFWCVNEVGHPDDIFNTTSAEVARKYSPVNIRTECNPGAPPEFHFGMIDLIRSQPRGDEPAYHPIFGGHGVARAAYTVDTLCDVDPGEIEWLTRMSEGAYGYVVPEDSDFDSMDDVVEYYQENPDAPVLTSPIGSGIHVALELWASQAGLGSLNYIPTEGTADTRNVLLGGGAEFGSLVVPPGGAEGLKILAVSGDERYPEPLSDIPTMQEHGWELPGAVSASGYALLRGAPEEHKQWLYALFSLVAESEEWADINPGRRIMSANPEESEAWVNDFLDAALPVLDETGIAVCDVDRR